MCKHCCKLEAHYHGKHTHQQNKYKETKLFIFNREIYFIENSKEIPEKSFVNELLTCPLWVMWLTVIATFHISTRVVRA